ncbi:MerR family transcriptional regulator [Solibacillus daqui]|uniref:MerR family transcriptional regulator n=1 Tax=Solibacillus daqui TaxID=2912187 RepID=UPI0023654D23|nr:MerR family transcriptional regulator [Solibacillus daqui]
MYLIGEIAKITKVSTRMLRHYEKERLLNPAVNEENGYRQYTEEDIDTIEKIKRLRKYHYSIAEIQTIFEKGLYHSPGIYKEKLDQLNGVVEEYQQLIDELQEENIPSKLVKNNYDVLIGNRKGFDTIFKRAVIKEFHLERFLEDTVENMYKQPFTLGGKFFVVFHDMSQMNEGELDVGVFQPIENRGEHTDFELLPFSDAIYISTIHYGTYNTISRAYIQLFRYAEENDYEIIGEFMERYLVDGYYTLYVEEFITEIFVTVALKKP